MNQLFDPEDHPSPDDKPPRRRRKRRTQPGYIRSDGEWAVMAFTNSRPEAHRVGDTPDHASHFYSAMTKCDRFGRVLTTPAEGTMISPCKKCLELS